jgi:uncharacterized protein YybS (DUF2232 family)
MAAQGGVRPGDFFHPRILLLSSAFILSAVSPFFLGWLTGFLAVPVIYILRDSGEKQGGMIIRNSLILAFVAAVLYLPILPAILFSFTLVPLGYSLHKSAIRGKDGFRAGGTGVIVLAASWLLFWTGFGIARGFNPYIHLLQMMDGGLKETLELYNKSSQFSPEVLLDIELMVGELRSLIPRILPGLLGCCVIITVWLNQIVCNALLQRFKPENAPWPRYSTWQLPDKLVWLPIGAGILVLAGSNGTRDIGLCVGMACCVIYFFQGFAIFIHLLEKWKIPGLFRIVLYLIIVVQSFGFIMLAMLGLADVWLDFRKLQQHNQQTNN